MARFPCHKLKHWMLSCLLPNVVSLTVPSLCLTLLLSLLLKPNTRSLLLESPAANILANYSKNYMVWIQITLSPFLSLLTPRVRWLWPPATGTLVALVIFDAALTMYNCKLVKAPILCWKLMVLWTSWILAPSYKTMPPSCATMPSCTPKFLPSYEQVYKRIGGIRPPNPWVLPRFHSSEWLPRQLWPARLMSLSSASMHHKIMPWICMSILL